MLRERREGGWRRHDDFCVRCAMTITCKLNSKKEKQRSKKIEFVRCGWIVFGCVHIKDQDIDGGISKCKKDSAKKATTNYKQISRVTDVKNSLQQDRQDLGGCRG